MKKQPTLKLLESLMQTVKDHRTLTLFSQRNTGTKDELVKLWKRFSHDNQDELMSMDFDIDAIQLYQLSNNHHLIGDHHLICDDIHTTHWLQYMEDHYAQLVYHINVLRKKETQVLN